MKCIQGVFLLILVLITDKPAVAQPNGGSNKTTTANNKAKKVFMPQAYLANTEYKGGTIKRDELSRLMRQGITSRDSMGNKYKVASFQFGYAERVLYEDSSSNMMVLVDYMTEYCPGDTLTPGISASIYERIKPGDTVYFDRVSVYKAMANRNVDEIIAGKGMKFVVTR
jgi:hypothetical protein